MEAFAQWHFPLKRQLILIKVDQYHTREIYIYRPVVLYMQLKDYCIYNLLLPRFKYLKTSNYK